MSATPERRPEHDAAPRATAPIGVRTRAVVSGHWLFIALVAAVATAAIVFVLLPRWLAPQPTSAKPAPVAAPAPARAPNAAEAVRQRLAAEEAKARFETALQSARNLHAESWAVEEVAAATEDAARASAAVASGDFAGGTRLYDAASRRLKELAGRAEGVYTDALARGEAAVQSGEQARAVEAFELAIAIHPDSADAQAGLARAAALDKVLAEMKSGDAHAQSGEWGRAREDYARAVKLDPAFGPAKEALARAERKLADQKFAQLVARGLGYLDRADWADAERAFVAAARLRPGDRSAADGLARAKEGLERKRLADLERDARGFEATERWTDALAAYRRALAVDPTLDFAKRGAERSEKMVKLHAALDALLANPKRLYSKSVQDEARRVLAAAETSPAGGPRLAQGREELDAALRRATTPVTVRLASDDATEVTVYRVGPLGKFRAREVELAPGTYTVVGSRAGYKDVRIELTVDPEKPSPRVFVACREPV